jgi:hypothetical protein
MKVKELIEYLQSFDGDMNVILSSDAEGNYFDKVQDVRIMLYDSDDRMAFNLEDFEEVKDVASEQAVCIWP